MPPDDQFDALYRALFPRLAAEMYAYLGDRGDAEDVAQEALLRAWRRWSVIGRYEEPGAWVRRVAWNLATSRWRRVAAAARTMTRLQAPVLLDGPGPDHVALVAALRTLPRAPRRAIILHYIADLPVAQVAQEMAVPRGTVLSWLHRGRIDLAKRMSEQRTSPMEATRHD